jgi:type I restriction enzyme, S subunit
MSERATLPRAARQFQENEGRRFRPYPEYRDSGVEWLGDLPAHWKIRKLKYIASLRTSNVDKKSHEDEQPVRLCNYTDVYYNEQIGADLAFMEATASPEEIDRFSLMKGDVLITKDSEDPNDIAVPACVVDDLDGVLCGYHLAQVRSNPSLAHGPYLARAFKASGIRDQFNSQATGITRHGLSKDTIGCSQFLVPPLDEQRAIAVFLDRETARIDELIAKKQRLLELLAEKRTALINHAVTKGLNPDAPMMDSGIDWLGDVPRHWQVTRIKFLAQVGNGSTPSRETPEYWNGWFPWLNSSVVNLTEVTEPVELVSDLALRECHLPRICPPTVLVGITGEGKTRGMVTLLRIESTINQHLAYVRPASPGCIVEYVRYVLHSAYQLLRDESSGGGSTKGAITCEQLRNTAIPHPPASEQAEIIRFIDGARAQLDALAAHSETVIAHLSEYRAALISAAVTGQIDVRNDFDNLRQESMT